MSEVAAMCRNEECIREDCCERRTAQPSKDQQFWRFHDVDGAVCQMYYPNEKGRVFDILAKPINPAQDHRAFQTMGPRPTISVVCGSEDNQNV